MSQQKSNQTNITPQQVISLLCSSPNEGFELILQTRIYLYDNIGGIEFWSQYQKLNLHSLVRSFPDEHWIFDWIGKSRILYDLFKLYGPAIRENEDNLRLLRPNYEALLKSVFLALEMGDYFVSDKSLPLYSEASLTAAKDILKKYPNSVQRKKGACYSIEIFNCVKQLLMLKIDYATLWEMIHDYENGDYELTKSENDIGYIMHRIPSLLSKQTDFYILNKLKTEVKKHSQKDESQDKVSQGKHFKAVDPYYRTNEGLAVSGHSGAVFTSNSPGAISLEINTGAFDKLMSNDERVRTEGQVEVILPLIEQHFHYHYRHSLASVYNPNDLINIHKQEISISDSSKIKLFDLFCAVATLDAYAHEVLYLSFFVPVRNIGAITETIFRQLQNNYPTTEEALFNERSISTFVGNLREIEMNNSPFYFLEEKQLLNCLKKSEDLKLNSDTELIHILNLLSSFENRLPFNTLYQINGGYYFSYRAHLKFDFNRIVYDHYVTDKLFNVSIDRKFDGDLAEKSRNSSERESDFNSSIGKHLSLFANGVKTNLHYNENNLMQTRRDIDVLAYFKRENALLAIQVKLSNTTKRDKGGQQEWSERHIFKKAVEQVEADCRFLKSENGLKYVRQELDMDSKIFTEIPRVYHLVVTDNFYVDHVLINVANDSKSFMSISFFELTNLILNKRVDPAQAHWENVIEKKSLKYLLQLIRSNVFWSFLKDRADQYSEVKQLYLINEINKIKLVI